MVGYRTDQFFNRIEAGEPVPNFDNYEFSFPDNTIRGEDASGKNNTLLKKGYVRTLQRSVEGKNVPGMRCRFQFNPQTLTQSVQQASGMTDFIHTDPAQYVRPAPSNVNFSFRLLFDRTMEMNNTLPTDSANIDINTRSPWSLGPSVVGVLHDLDVFFSTIGQGFSSKQIDYMKFRIDQELTYEFNDEVALYNTSGSTGAAPDEEAQRKKIEATQEFVNNNLGNTGFLLPVPIRVVFSTLYIVEGLVTATDVLLTKFNSALVPTQCTVTVNMEAKYIGYAKKNTFLTWVLDNERKAQLDKIRQDQDAAEALRQAASSLLSEIQVKLYGKSGFESGAVGYVSLDQILKSRTTRFVGVLELPRKSSGNLVETALSSGNAGVSFSIRYQLSVYGFGSKTPYPAIRQVGKTRGDDVAFKEFALKGRQYILFDHTYRVSDIASYNNASLRDSAINSPSNGYLRVYQSSSNGAGPDFYDKEDAWYAVYLTATGTFAMNGSTYTTTNSRWFSIPAVKLLEGSSTELAPSSQQAGTAGEVGLAFPLSLVFPTAAASTGNNNNNNNNGGTSSVGRGDRPGNTTQVIPR